MDCSKCWWKVRYAGAAYCQHWAKAPRPLSRGRLFSDELVVAKLQRDKRKRGNAAGLLAMLVAMAETGS